MHRTPESEPSDRDSGREPAAGSDHEATRPLPPSPESQQPAQTTPYAPQGNTATPGQPHQQYPQQYAQQPYAQQYGQPQYPQAGHTAQSGHASQPGQPAAQPGSQQQPFPGQPQQHTYAGQSQAHQSQSHAAEAPAGESPSQPYAGGTPPLGPSGPATGGSGGSGGPGGSGDSQRKGRSGTLVAGLAIGALLGAVVGGGVGAVVAANVSQTSVTAGGSGGTLTLQNTDTATQVSGVAAAATPSVVTLDVASSNASGAGSGVIISDDGYILTNAHVATLDGAATNGADISVKFSDGRILKAELVGTDPYADLAVVKVDAEGLTPAKFADSSKINVGDLTVAIGAPLNLSNTVTSGVVSALNRGISVGSPLIPENPDQPDQDQPDGENGFPWDFRFGTPDDEGQQQPEEQQQSAGGSVTLPVVQTDASINPGNSGGALLNGDGEIIGINVAIASNAGAEAAGSDGLGFAIPSNLANRISKEIIAGDQPSHGQLGISVADSAQDSDADASVAGGLVASVEKGGPAAEAGLKEGDVITAIDGVPAIDGTSVSALVRYHKGGSDVKIDYTRNGKADETTATLGTLEW